MLAARRQRSRGDSGVRFWEWVRFVTGCASCSLGIGGRWECYFRIGGRGAIARLLQPVGLRKKRTVRFAAFFAGRSRASLLVDQMKTFSYSSLSGLFSRSVPRIFLVLVYPVEILQGLAQICFQGSKRRQIPKMREVRCQFGQSMG